MWGSVITIVWPTIAKNRGMFTLLRALVLCCSLYSSVVATAATHSSSLPLDELLVWLAGISKISRQGEFSEHQWFNQNMHDITCSHNSGTADIAGHTDGMHWVFGVPLYIVDVGEMEEDNAVLTAIIKEQFEQLDAGGWGKDRTYPGAAKAASEMQPADRNDEFVSLKLSDETELLVVI